jgi:excisionase family DNA binding protein
MKVLQVVRKVSFFFLTNELFFWYVLIVLILRIGLRIICKVSYKNRSKLNEVNTVGNNVKGIVGGRLMERLLKPHEVAKLLRVTTACLLSWVESGIFPAIKVNKTVRFRRGDIEWFIKKQYTGGCFDAGVMDSYA